MTLEQRVTEYVLAHPGSTGFEIAVGVKARLGDVRQVLSGETFTASPRAAYRSDRAVVYHVCFDPQDAPGTADRAARRRTRPSQCDLVAAVLRDGRFHTAAEIHQRCGYSRLNSRIAELRSRRGLNIVCEHVPGAGTGPDAYRYRLVGASEEAAPRPIGAASSDVPAGLSPSRSVGDSLPSQAGASEPEQLTMEAA